ncbi:MAG: YbhB/YbcL family Raf kinase inhibitor-like protein [Gemmatimonadota bacterium]|jgi:Raf kinase inhibitor-like YbhB/YbcL family protein|nr:YbhB/YbcL family Raf kinase inhibitor-like protein [Gemmatimonadota bacterium]
MKLLIDAFPDGGIIPDRYAFGKPDPETHVTFSENRNPGLHWSDPPAGTRSFVLICHDSDAPSIGNDVNREGRSVSRDLPRASFFHWVVIDIPAGVRGIAEGVDSDRVTPRGKASVSGERGRTGRNDYTGWFTGDSQLEGVYHGYDGPGPPWNDERVHNYIFTVYALDVDHLELDLPESTGAESDGGFGGEDVLRALGDHVLGRAEWSGRYTLNPALREG